MRGKVKFFNRRRGFGYVTGDDGNDYFLSFAYFKNREDGKRINVYINDILEFDTVDGEKGPRADEVVLIESAERVARASEDAQEDAEA